MSESLHSILLPYQRKWIADTSQVKVYEKSRRIGITWCEAADRALSAASRNGMDGWYIGYNQEMAREFIEDAAAWAKRFNKAAAAIEETVFKDENRDILAYRIQFASEHKVVALSSRPSNLRGRDGCAVLDEAAFHDDLPELLKAALAFTMWGGKVHVISTHNGADNAFNDLITDIRAGRKPYSLHRTTLDDALADGLFHAIARTRGIEWSGDAQRAWRDEVFAFYGDDAEEELLCVPNASSGVYLPSAMVESRMRPEIPVLRCEFKYSFLDRGLEQLRRDADDWINAELAPALKRLDPKLMTVFGEDFGRSGDLTVIWPLQVGQGMIRRTPFVVELRNVPFRQQEQILFHIVDRLPRFCGGAMDARGNGQYLAETAQQRYGAGVEAVMLSAEWYRENMPRYKAAFEDGNIELPKDADILGDHRMVRMERGIARVGEGRGRGEDGGQRHGDSAIAGALAYYASTRDHEEYAYTPAFSQGRSTIGEIEDEDVRRPGRFGSMFGRMRFGRGAW